MVDSAWSVRKGARLIRILIGVNFVLMLALIGPGRSHELDLVLRRIGLEDLIGRSLQVWIVGSTILTTALFAGIAWKKRRMKPSETPLPRIRVEGMLLLAWWVTLLGLLAYGFMLGMGG
jgi:hypothetical protein